MSWNATLVHGPQDENSANFETFEEALRWAEDLERAAHSSREEDPFESMKALYSYENLDGGGAQFGTNYHYVVFQGCTCTNSCPEDSSQNDCPYCRNLDIYDPCPVVGFGCGTCGDVEDPCCTPEQQKAANS